MSTISDDFIGQRTRRLQSLQALRELGINPFTPYSKKDKENKDVKENFGEYENKEITLTGRLTGKREHGKLIFGDIQDESGSLQIAIKQNEIQEDLKDSYLGWTHLKLVDIGDFIEVKGTIGKTQQGEITLFVTKFKLLTKSLRPLPVSFDEKEQQFRKRYLDLVVNPERKEVFKRKSLFWKVSRDFMNSRGYMEVETPVLEHVTGGADARPFITHHNTLDQDFFLRISTELYQKRLIGGGFEKIYTLGPNFRNEGMSDEHLQEYYQLEWYTAYTDYRDGMNLVKALFQELAQKVYGKTKFKTRGHEFDLSNDWEEIDYTNIIKEKYGIDIFKATEEEMLDVLKKQGVELPGAINRNRIIDNLWKTIRKTVSGPAFLVNQPMFISPLAKSLPEKPELTQRFQVIIAGSELGNGYSEINDPVDQLDRFLEQQKMRFQDPLLDKT
jgi:lysyl-tRNA synthetase class 2